MEKHFHTIEIIFIAGISAAVVFHTMRYVGGKMSKSATPALAKTGAALAGAFTFGAPQ